MAGKLQEKGGPVLAFAAVVRVSEEAADRDIEGDIEGAADLERNRILPSKTR